MRVGSHVWPVMPRLGRPFWWGMLLVPACWSVAVCPMVTPKTNAVARSEEHTSELQSRGHLVCRLLLEKKKKTMKRTNRCKTLKQKEQNIVPDMARETSK